MSGPTDVIGFSSRVAPVPLSLPEGSKLMTRLDHYLYGAVSEHAAAPTKMYYGYVRGRHGVRNVAAQQYGRL